MRYLTAVAVVMVALAAPVAGQTAATADSVLTAEQLAQFGAERRDPFVAGAMEFVLPTLGFGYVGEWPQGAALTAATVAGAWIIGTGDAELDQSWTGTSAGVGVLIAGRLLSIYAAVSEAHDYNRELRSRLLINYAPDGGGRLLAGLSVRF